MSTGPLVVTYPLSERSRAIVAAELQGAAPVIYLATAGGAAGRGAAQRWRLAGPRYVKGASSGRDPTDPQRAAVAVHSRRR